MHAGARIIVEHAFGYLKGRFPALKEMPGRNMERIYRGVEALMILSNIFRHLDDCPDEIPDFDLDEALAEDVHNRLQADPEAGVIHVDEQAVRAGIAGETEGVLRTRGRLLRDQIMADRCM